MSRLIKLLTLLEARYKSYDTDDDEENIDYSEEEESDYDVGYSTLDSSGNLVDEEREDDESLDDESELRLHADLGHGDEYPREEDEPDLQDGTAPVKPGKTKSDGGKKPKSRVKQLSETIARETEQMYQTIRGKIYPFIEYYSECGTALPSADPSAWLEKYTPDKKATWKGVQCMVNDAERIGIAAARAGVEPYGFSIGKVIDSEDIAKMFYMSAPFERLAAARLDRTGDLVFPQVESLSELAFRVSKHISGAKTAGKAVPSMPSEVPLYKCKWLTVTRYSNDTDGKAKPSVDKGAESNEKLTGAGMAIYDGTVPGEGRYVVPTVALDSVIRAIVRPGKGNAESMAALLKNNTAENIASDVLYLGPNVFKQQHHGLCPSAPGLRSSLFGSWDVGSDGFRCTKTLCDYLSTHVFDAAYPKAGVRTGTITAPDGHELTRREVDEMRSAFNVGGKRGITTLTDERLHEYVDGGYQFNGKPMFSYFHIEGTEFNSDGLKSNDDSAMANDHSVVQKDMVDRMEEMDDLVTENSENAERRDARLNDRLGKSGVAALIGACTGELSIPAGMNARERAKVIGDYTEGLKAASDLTKYEVLSKFLLKVSSWFDGYSLSRISLDRRGKLVVTIDPSEYNTEADNKISSVWMKLYNDAKEQYGELTDDGRSAKSDDVPEFYRNIYTLVEKRGIVFFGLIRDIVDWFSTFEAKPTAQLSELGTYLMGAAAEHFDDLLDRITPRVNMYELVSDYLIPNYLGMLSDGLPGTTVGGREIGGFDVSQAVMRYLNRCNASCDLALLYPNGSGYERLVRYIIVKYGDDMEHLADIAAGNSKPAEMTDAEFRVIQLMMSTVLDINRPTLAPPDKYDPDGDLPCLLEMAPQKIQRWVTGVYLKSLPTNARLVSEWGALVMTALGAAREDRLDTRKRISSDMMDNVEEAMYGTMPIDSIAAVYGDTMVAVAGYAVGDGGEALNRVMNFISEAEPADSEEEAESVAEAVRTLSDKSYMVFEGLPK